MSSILPVAGYYRVSVARDDMRSPQLYEDEIQRYCGYKNLELAHVYSDVDYSAFRGAKARPSLEQLIANRHGYSQIIIPKLSRFGRSMKELVRLFELFDSDDIPLVFLDMNLDTSTSQGRLLRHILAAFAEYESDVKADYTRANHRRIRAEGRPWGTAPFGYRKGALPATWVIDKPRAALVKQIFTDYAAGTSGNAIARGLNAAGITTPRGKQWKGQAIGKLLDNPAYAGLSLVDSELVPAQWVPIVSRAGWDAVRQRRDSDPRRRGNLGKPRPAAPYLLSGLMWCGLCGRKMTHTTTTRDKRGVYHCAGDVWGNWSGCLDMRVHGDLAEVDVSRQFLDRCAFTILTGTGVRAGSPRTLWAEASLNERKRLLGLVIERIVVTPREMTVSRSQYRKVLRHDLSIEFKSAVTGRDEIVVLADAATPIERRVASDGRHQMLRAAEYRRVLEQGSVEQAASTSWAQWRRERLLPQG